MNSLRHLNQDCGVGHVSALEVGAEAEKVDPQPGLGDQRDALASHHRAQPTQKVRRFHGLFT